MNNRATRLIRLTLDSTLDENTRSVENIISLEDLQSLYNNGKHKNFKGDGFYWVDGNVYDEGRIAKIKNSRDGCVIWTPTPYHVLEECLRDVVTFINWDALDKESENIIRKKKEKGDSYDLNEAFDNLYRESLANYTFVELGCGDARASIFSSGVHGMKSVGIDVDPEMLDIAKKNVRVLQALSVLDEGQVQLLEANILDEEVVKSVLASEKRKGVVLYFYLPSDVTLKAVELYIPFLKANDYVAMHRARLSENLEKSFETKLRVSKWMGPPIQIYKVQE
jgi:hypothetical protein